MNTKEKIVAAAIEIFSRKGKHGARMEEIAEQAKINKAMLYYYYSTKENLYKEVLSFVVKELFAHIEESFQGIKAGIIDHVKIVRTFTEAHFEAFTKNDTFTRIFLEAVTSEQDELKLAMCGPMGSVEHRKCIHSIIKDGSDKGVFRKVDPKQVVMSIIGMNMVYLATKPIANSMMGIDAKDEAKFLKERKNSIIDMVLNGITTTHYNPHPLKVKK